MSKILLFSLLVLGATSKALSAQTITYCGIWFDYDAAGNRVSRYPGCKTFDISKANPNVPPPPISARMIKNNPANNDEVIPTVSPNPTGGKYQIFILGNDANVYFEWYSMSGQVIDQGSFKNSSFSGDVSKFPPGNYFLKIFWKDKSFRYKMTKDN